MFWYRPEQDNNQENQQNETSASCDEVTKNCLGKVWTVTLNSESYGFVKSLADVDRLLEKLHVSACSTLEPTHELMITHNTDKTHFQITHREKNSIFYRSRCIYDLRVRKCKAIDVDLFLDQQNDDFLENISNSENDDDQRSATEDEVELDEVEEPNIQDNLADNNKF